MTGPVPRLNGKPDLSGVWKVTGDPRGPAAPFLGESGNSPYFRNVLADFVAGGEPLTKLGAELSRAE